MIIGNKFGFYDIFYYFSIFNTDICKKSNQIQNSIINIDYFDTAYKFYYFYMLLAF